MECGEGREGGKEGGKEARREGRKEGGRDGGREERGAHEIGKAETGWCGEHATQTDILL